MSTHPSDARRGAAITKRREELGLSYFDVAARMTRVKEVGSEAWHFQVRSLIDQLRRWERGLSSPETWHWRLLKALETTSEQLWPTEADVADAPAGIPFHLEPTDVYVLRNADGATLYVGMTFSVSSRLYSHHAREWWPEVSSIDVRHCATRLEARDLEEQLIIELDPPHNTQRRGAQVVAA